MLRFATVTIAGLAVLLPAGAAHAEPTPAEIEAQITKAWNELEPTIEEYNKTNSSLQTNSAKKAELEKALQPLELQVDLALSRVGTIARQSYKEGSFSTFNAVLNAGNQDNLAEQLSMLNVLSRKERTEIKDVAATRDKYRSEKATLDKLVTDLTQQTKDLAEKKKTIEAQITSLQKLRQQAYGASGSTGTFKPVACPYVVGSGAGQVAATKACNQIGKAYVWGAAGPSNFDCSGLTLYAWAATVSLTHNAAGQYAAITHVTRANLKTGDLVFFGSSPANIHHVGIYVGDSWMVHAPQTGDYVRMAKIDVMGETMYYGRPA